MEKLLQQVNHKDDGPSTNKHFVAISSIIVLLALSGFMVSINTGDPLTIKHWLNDENHWMMVVLFSFLLMFICAATPLPAEAITIANGAVFGPLLGTLITWLSAMLGAGITFLYGRYLLNKRDFHLINNADHQKLSAWINKWGSLGFVLARLIPVVPFFALNIGAAFLPVSAKNYFLITGICILPHIMIICFFSGHITGY